MTTWHQSDPARAVTYSPAPLRTRPRAHTSPTPRAARRTPRPPSPAPAAPPASGRRTLSVPSAASRSSASAASTPRGRVRRAAGPAGRICWASIAGSTRSGSYGLLLVQLEAVDADHDPLAGVRLLGDAVGVALDLLLLEAPLDGGHRTAHVLDPPHQRDGGLLGLVRHRLDGVGTGERIDGGGHIASRTRAPAGCAAPAGPTCPWAGRWPRRRSWCAATGCRRARRRGPGG